MPRNRAAAIVIHDNKLLVMYRKNEREYYTFPGGGIEAGETNEQTAIREIKEECSVDIILDKLVHKLHHDNGDIHYYFLANYVSGTIAVQPGTNEYADNESGLDIHQPQWLPLDTIPQVVLYSLEVRDRLLADLTNSFSDGAITLNLPAAN